MSTVIPFGYGFKESMQVLQQLMEDPTTYLVDIRKSPKTGYTGFNDYELKQQFRDRYVPVLELGNLNYKGGPIRIANPIQGIDRLVKGLNKGYRLVVLCGCRDYDGCHRKTAVELLKGTMPDVEVLQPDEVTSSDMGKTISIMQPWFWVIMNGKLLQEHGIPPKLIENRTWTTKYRGPVFLRAGSFDNEFFERGKLGSSLVWYAFSRMVGDDHARKLYELMPKSKSEYLSGGVAGQCNLVDVLDWHDDGDWKAWEQYGLVLSGIEEIPFVSVKGAFKLFEIPVCHCCSMPAPDHISEIVGEGKETYRLCVDCIK